MRACATLIISCSTHLILLAIFRVVDHGGAGITRGNIPPMVPDCEGRKMLRGDRVATC